MNLKSIRKVFVNRKNAKVLKGKQGKETRTLCNGNNPVKDSKRQKERDLNLSQSTLRTDGSYDDDIDSIRVYEVEEEEEEDILDKLIKFDRLDTVERKPTKATKPRKPRKQVSFQQTVAIYDVLSIHDMTNEEVDAAWWSRDDLTTIGDRARALCERHGYSLGEAIDRCHLKARRFSSGEHPPSTAELSRSVHSLAQWEHWVVKGDSCRGLERFLSSNVGGMSRIPAKCLSNPKILLRYHKRSRAAEIFCRMMALLDAEVVKEK